MTDNNLSFGNLTLDRSTFVLANKDKKDEGIRLNNKEFQMVEMLMVNPGQVISADRLMEKIWGFDSDAEQNTIWVYVSNIRKKLASLDANVGIKAVRGLGYALEEKA